MQQQTMINLTTIAEEMDSYDFVFWLDTLTPDKIMRLELHFRRMKWDRRADNCEAAGTANCGDEYYEL